VKRSEPKTLGHTRAKDLPSQVDWLGSLHGLTLDIRPSLQIAPLGSIEF